MIRLIVVDDQALVREGLTMILGARPEFAVVAGLPDGEALLALLTAEPGAADVILLDLYLPGADGVATLRALRARVPSCPARVVLLTAVGRPADVRRGLSAGADGFVLKDSTGDELAAAVSAAHAGIRPLSASVTGLLWPPTPASPASARADTRAFDRADTRAFDRADTRAFDRTDAPAASRFGTLTARERDVLRLLGEGRGNREIAGALRIAEQTVKAHVSSVLTKLAVASRTQAALLARDL